MSCPRTQHGASGEARSRNLLILSQALQFTRECYLQLVIEGTYMNRLGTENLYLHAGQCYAFVVVC